MSVVPRLRNPTTYRPLMIIDERILKNQTLVQYYTVLKNNNFIIYQDQGLSHF